MSLICFLLLNLFYRLKDDPDTKKTVPENKGVNETEKNIPTRPIYWQPKVAGIKTPNKRKGLGVRKTRRHENSKN